MISDEWMFLFYVFAIGLAWYVHQDMTPTTLITASNMCERFWNVNCSCLKMFVIIIISQILTVHCKKTFQHITYMLNMSAKHTGTFSSWLHWTTLSGKTMKVIFFFIIYVWLLCEVLLWLFEMFVCFIIPHWKFPMLKPYTKAGTRNFVRSHCYITRYLRETTNWLLLAIISPVTSLSFSSRHFYLCKQKQISVILKTWTLIFQGKRNHKNVS